MGATCQAHLTLLDMIKLHTVKLFTNILLEHPVTSPSNPLIQRSLLNARY
jgi:hypothetical protein